MKTKLYRNKLGIFLFLPQGRYFLLYMYNFCIKGHLLIYGYIKVWPVKKPMGPNIEYIMLNDTVKVD
jgi:hypothetical protein